MRWFYGSKCVRARRRFASLPRLCGFQIGDELPALLLGEAAPGGHAVGDGAGGDEPKEFTVGATLRGPLGGEGMLPVPCADAGQAAQFAA